MITTKSIEHIISQAGLPKVLILEAIASRLLFIALAMGIDITRDSTGTVNIAELATNEHSCLKQKLKATMKPVIVASKAAIKTGAITIPMLNNLATNLLRGAINVVAISSNTIVPSIMPIAMVWLIR